MSDEQVNLNPDTLEGEIVPDNTPVETEATSETPEYASIERSESADELDDLYTDEGEAD